MMLSYALKVKYNTKNSYHGNYGYDNRKNDRDDNCTGGKERCENYRKADGYNIFIGDYTSLSLTLSLPPSLSPSLLISQATQSLTFAIRASAALERLEKNILYYTFFTSRS